MKRTLIAQTPEKVGKKIKLAGWINNRRDHGKLVFIDLRDRTGSIQVVVIPDKEKAYNNAKLVRSEYVVEIEGLIKERPCRAGAECKPTDRVEIEAEKINILAETDGELPVDISLEDMNLNLETLLNHRSLTLRNKKVNAIFKIYSEELNAYSEALRRSGFTEIKSPKIVNAATEGGANFFKIKYFDKDAYLAQSPQFYKQAAVGAFERVFEIGSVFRAEPHFTTRHVNEYIGLDGEMGFIDSFEDVMNQLEQTMAFVFEEIGKKCQKELALYGATVPEIKTIPRIKLTEALDILDKEYGKKIEGIDIDPEGERMICEWAKDKYDSELIFLTHYPSNARPFYTMPSEDPQYTESFDLLFRGVEIATGGQRIHIYQKLVENIKKHGLNPDDFKDYLDNFRFGMPPHGGWGLGSERVVQKILGIDNIKESVLFPRDVKRLNP